MNYLIPIFYTVIFSFIIYKAKLFSESKVKSWITLSFFYIKILTGIFVIYVYTTHYSNEKTSDVLLYYSDGKIISNSFYSNPSDFFRLISGIGCDNDYFFLNYFSKMDRWQRQHDSFFFNDCHTVIRFNAVVQLFSFGAIHAGTVIVCFLSLVGVFSLYRTFENILSEKRGIFLLAIIFSPALIFWTSSLFKESLLLFGLGLLIHSLFKILIEKNYTLLTFINLSIGIVFSLTVKIYVVLLLLPPLISFFIFYNQTLRFKLFYFLCINFTFFLLGLIIANSFLDRNFVKEIIRHQSDFINTARGGVYLYRDSTAVWLEYNSRDRIVATTKKDTVTIKPGSTYLTWNNNSPVDTLIVSNSTDTSEYWNAATTEPARSAYYMPRLEYSLSSFVSYAPEALMNVLFRPYFNEAENLYQKVCSVENIIYILILLVCIFFSDYKNANKELLWLGLVFSINLFLLIGFTTPVAGALVRYKAPAIPFLLLSAITLLDVEKARKIPILKLLFRN
ncbi:MAG: hypothetical protein ACK452_05410 [Bacteroidota bacterium]|jgi:hypothetical protein